MRVLSGIQPYRTISLGATISGAIRQYIDLQHEAEEAFYFIANLHALNTVRDHEELSQLTLDAALDLLALGLNPDKATLFVQSDIPEGLGALLDPANRDPDGGAARTLPCLQGQDGQGLGGQCRSLRLPGAHGR